MDEVRESALTYPCEFPIKVLGRREGGFAQEAIQLQHGHRLLLHAQNRGRVGHDRDLTRRRAHGRNAARTGVRRKSRAASAPRSPRKARAPGTRAKPRAPRSKAKRAAD